MILERRISAEIALAEATCEGFHLHVYALGVVLEVTNRFKGLPALIVSALERPIAVRVCQKVVLKVLLLLESFVAALVRALELALVALHVPIELALGDELSIFADWAFEF